MINNSSEASEEEKENPNSNSMSLHRAFGFLEVESKFPPLSN